MENSTGWVIPLALLSFTTSWFLQRPAYTTLLFFFFMLFLSPLYIRAESTTEDIYTYVFWNGMSVALGSLTGYFMVIVYRMPPLFNEAALFTDRSIGVRLATAMVFFIAATLCWALIPVPWLNWTMAWLVYELTVVGSALSLWWTNSWNISGRDVERALNQQLSYSTLLIFGMGTAESLVEPRWAPTVMSACTLAVLVALAVLHAHVLPNDVQQVEEINTVSDALARTAMDNLTVDSAIAAAKRATSASVVFN